MTWTIGDIVRSYAAQYHSREMLSYGGVSISYDDMDQRSNRVAQGLMTSGLNKDDRIAVLDKNCPEQFEILFGASKAGLVTVPVNWRLSSPEIVHIVSDSMAKLLFLGREFFESLPSLREELPSDLEIIVIGDEDGDTSFSSWVSRWEAVDPRVTVDPDATALQLYTSGTTGLPKGVMITNTNLFTLLDQGQALWGLDGLSRSVVCMPLFHIGGIGWGLACMRHGGSAYLVREFDPKVMLNMLEQSKITHANFVPAMLGPLVSAAKQANHEYPSLKIIVYGTAPVSRPLLLESIRTFGCDFAQLYGLTETTSAISQLDPSDHQIDGAHPERLNSAGRPYPWVEAKVVNPQDGTACNTFEKGELWVRSAQNMKGYWNNEEATNETLIDGGWLRTGDAGFFDADGYLFLTDRIKDMVVSGGENIYPAEVERVLAEHPSLAEVAVIGVPHNRWGETIKGVVVPRPGVPVMEADLISWCRDKISHYKCPTSIDVVEQLPRNAAGKVLKRELRKPYWEGRERQIN